MCPLAQEVPEACVHVDDESIRNVIPFPSFCTYCRIAINVGHSPETLLFVVLVTLNEVVLPRRVSTGAP